MCTVANDPEAAELVYNAGWEVTIVPLNVTHRFTLSPVDLDHLRTLSSVGAAVAIAIVFVVSWLICVSLYCDWSVGGVPRFLLGIRPKGCAA